MKIAGIVLTILGAVILIIDMAIHGIYSLSANGLISFVIYYILFALPLIIGIILLVIGIKKSKK